MNKRDEILSAATELFAERGYEGVTVREICATAEANVAMVNYHFRSKEGLYRECVERLFQRVGAPNALTLAEKVHDAKSWRAAVRDWVTGFFKVMHAQEGDMALAGHIYRHEVVHASSMHEFILHNYARPLRENLMELVRMAGLDDDDAFRWTASIWSLLSAHVIVDPVWRDEFRPAGSDETKWSDEFMEFVCERIFGELKYRTGNRRRKQVRHE